MRFPVCCKYFVPRSINHAVVLTHAANATLDRSGDLRSRITRDCSKKLSSMVITRCDEENQAFLTTDCNRLQGPFISPHSRRNYTQSALRTVVQGGQYTVDNAHGDN